MPTGMRAVVRAVARAVARTAERVVVHVAAHPAGAGRMALCPAEHVSTGTPAVGIAEGRLVSWRAPWS